jgi:hypothetical protein
MVRWNQDVTFINMLVPWVLFFKTATGRHGAIRQRDAV